MKKGQFNQIPVVLKVVCRQVTVIQALAHGCWFLSGDSVEQVEEKAADVRVHVLWIVGLRSQTAFRFCKYVVEVNCPFK